VSVESTFVKENVAVPPMLITVLLGLISRNRAAPRGAGVGFLIMMIVLTIIFRSKVAW
jgi:hypothetical protein